jgi:site-specific DNA-cytosine methylase
MIRAMPLHEREVLRLIPHETDAAVGIATAGARSTDRGTRVVAGAPLGSEVRRLTPTECERLQSLPDGWTFPFGPSLADVPYEALGGAVRARSCPVDYAPDSARYAGCGDAVTANVAEWVADRIRRVRPDG